ncbi:hypothetical protein GQ607_006090, partial [Colletotrichum asianum]
LSPICCCLLSIHQSAVISPLPNCRQPLDPLISQSLQSPRLPAPDFTSNLWFGLQSADSHQLESYLANCLSQLVNRPSATASSHFDTLRPTSGSSNPPLPLLRTLPHSYAYSSLFNHPSTYSPILSVLEAACFVCSIGFLLQPTPVLLHSLPATRTWDRLFLVSPLLRTLTAQSLATYVSLPFAAHGRPSFFVVSVHSPPPKTKVINILRQSLLPYGLTCYP